MEVHGIRSQYKITSILSLLLKYILYLKLSEKSIFRKIRDKLWEAF